MNDSPPVTKAKQTVFRDAVIRGAEIQQAEPFSALILAQKGTQNCA